VGQTKGNSTGSAAKESEGRETWSFRGICISVPKQKDIGIFKRMISEVLPSYGCNTLVLLIRYSYQFQSHPEVTDQEALTSSQAAEIAALCRANGVRVIPKMNLLGHQSGKGTGSELGLLRAHPEFDETPDQPSVRYCRSLCPRHPDVKQMVFDLGDELIDAFQADAIHVGLDEVFEIGRCPRCKGSSNAELFAEWVNTLYDHFVGKDEVEMFMWGDRLLDSEETEYGEWEASANGTSAAIDHVPTDIIVCDWHYGKRDSYPSIPILTDKGFRVVACPWKEMEATEALLGYAKHKRGERLLGVLATTWCDSGTVARYLCGVDAAIEGIPRQAAESFKTVMMS